MADLGAFISGCSGLTLTPDEERFFERSNPFGLILFRRNCADISQVKALTAAFRSAVGRRNAPVFIDQEGGRVQRLGPPVWRAYPAARAYGELYARDAVAALRCARHVGRLMAEDLYSIGITANCVPVLDVPQPGAHEIIGQRAYALSPDTILILARAHAAGFLEGGVLPVIKHIPGHGRATADSHLDLPVINAKLADLTAVDFLPFAGFSDAVLGMTAHVVYTDIDALAPATQSRRVVSDIIRKLIGFDGLLMTDDLSMKALSGSYTERTIRALAAGCDLVLHCNGELAEMEEVASAAGKLKGKSLSRARIALQSVRKPRGFDRRQAVRDLGTLMDQ
ncbi:beta-N-acetylhexosaminidase [Aestuariivirga sp.]|jgi:beta-N-acetylhexosaminidase|uniref:beta-N-acetylhexosaminidase n=1 Tax=Aestuariivirga sp. TaxID=2650926 RepID=UPI0037851DD2